MLFILPGIVLEIRLYSIYAWPVIYGTEIVNKIVTDIISFRLRDVQILQFDIVTWYIVPAVTNFFECTLKWHK